MSPGRCVVEHDAMELNQSVSMMLLNPFYIPPISVERRLLLRISLEENPSRLYWTGRCIVSTRVCIVASAVCCFDVLSISRYVS